MKRLFGSAATILLLVGVFAACATNAEPRVSFVEPQNGATVSGPVKIKMAAQNIKVEPAGAVNAGAGHFHIMIDANCVAAGQAIPTDEQHKHFGKAQLETELTLAPGVHRLCLQMADGAHNALPDAGLSQQISITVK